MHISLKQQQKLQNAKFINWQVLVWRKQSFGADLSEKKNELIQLILGLPVLFCQCEDDVR